MIIRDMCFSVYAENFSVRIDAGHRIVEIIDLFLIKADR